MKTPLLGGTLLALMVIPVSALRAQAADVTGGTMTITLDPAFRAELANEGVTTTLGGVSADTAVKAPVQSGLFDLATGSGEFQTKCSLYLTNSSGASIHVHELSVSTSGAFPVVLGNVYANRVFMGRQTVFAIISSNPMEAPMRAGAVISPGVELTASPYLLNLVGTTFSTVVLKNYKGVSHLESRLSVAAAEM